MMADFGELVKKKSRPGFLLVAGVIGFSGRAGVTQ